VSGDRLVRNHQPLAYYRAGWHPIRLPAGAKDQPPTGRTGGGGVDMTEAEIVAADWSGNVGLRMPPDVIGLDVDVYKGGGVTLKELVDRLGPLPNTRISYSGRNDNSGIRFFRVPAGRWVAGLPGIEVIQRHHRYAAVAPSLHPEGRKYGWWDQSEDAPTDDVPLVEDLPELPWAWIDELSLANSADTGSKAVAPTEAAEFLDGHVKAEKPGYIAGAIEARFRDRWKAGYSRHDTMQHCLIWAMECVRAGLAAGRPTVQRLADVWVEAVQPDGRRMQLSNGRGTTEFEAMLRHAVGKAQAKSETEITDLHDSVAFVPIKDRRPALEQSAPEEPEAVMRFRRYSVKELLAEDRTMNWDVTGMLSRPTYGLDGGELKSLKSYFALARAVGLTAGVPVLGQWKVPERKRVLAFVAEGGRMPFTTRLERMCQAHGVKAIELDGWLEVITEVAPLDSRRFREALAAALAEFRPGLVWLDPLYPFQPQTVSSSQLSEVGAMLTAAHLLCAEYGATFWVTAHMNQTGNGFDLKRIAGAGPGEWADSWALLKHRSPPDVPAGKFRLRLDLGSRQWGGSSWDLDLNIGRYVADMGLHDGPITWHLQPVSTVQVAAPDPLIDVKVAVLAAGRHIKKPTTKTGWVDRVGRRQRAAAAAFDELVAEGAITEVPSAGRWPKYIPKGTP
jgi:hypothetical protein